MIELLAAKAIPFCPGTRAMQFESAVKFSRLNFEQVYGTLKTTPPRRFVPVLMILIVVVPIPSPTIEMFDSQLETIP